MTNVFDFTDFRLFLRNYYEDRKKANPHYSYQVLTEKAGFSNKGYLFNVMNGTRKLSKLNASQLAKALAFSSNEKEYFECIVAYTQAESEKEKTYFLRQALQASSNENIRFLKKDQFEYYSTWHHSAIRSLVEIFPVTDNYSEIGRLLSPSLTGSQVKKSIQLLERLELIKRDSAGRYHLTEKHLRTSADISRTARNQFHIECTDLAKNAILNSDPDTRHALSMTLGISAKLYKEIIAETKTFVDTIVKMVNRSGDDPEQVYQYELLLFPVSKPLKKD